MTRVRRKSVACGWCRCRSTRPSSSGRFGRVLEPRLGWMFRTIKFKRLDWKNPDTNLARIRDSNCARGQSSDQCPSSSATWSRLGSVALLNAESRAPPPASPLGLTRSTEGGLRPVGCRAHPHRWRASHQGATESLNNQFRQVRKGSTRPPPQPLRTFGASGETKHLHSDTPQ